MRTTTYGLAVFGVCACLAGCGEKKITIAQVPPFYNENLKAIAVVPFQSLVDDGRAGEIVSEEFARALQKNNTYRVFAQNDLKAIMDQQDIEIFASTGNTAVTAARFRGVGAQAVMVGSVTMYATSREEQKRRISIPLILPAGGYSASYAGSFDHRYTKTFIEATVSVSVALIRVSDGTQIYAATETGRASERSSNPKRDENACLRDATAEAVGKLLEQFAMVSKDVKIGSKAIGLGRDGLGGTRKTVDRLSAGDSRALLILELPVPCDRNTFRWLICRKGGDCELDGETFVWDREESAREGGMVWDICPAQLARDGGGPGTYTVQLIRGREIVVTKDFRIDKAQGLSLVLDSIERPQREPRMTMRRVGNDGDAWDAKRAVAVDMTFGPGSRRGRDAGESAASAPKPTKASKPKEASRPREFVEW